MKTFKKILKSLLIILVLFILIKYLFVLFIIWGTIEVIIWSIRLKTIVRLKDFICNFVITVLNCIDILANIVLQIPANRILLKSTTTTTRYKFGDNPKNSFTKVLRMNFLYNNLKPRGVTLYNIIVFLK